MAPAYCTLQQLEISPTARHFAYSRHTSNGYVTSKNSQLLVREERVLDLNEGWEKNTMMRAIYYQFLSCAGFLFIGGTYFDLQVNSRRLPVA